MAPQDRVPPEHGHLATVVAAIGAVRPDLVERLRSIDEGTDVFEALELDSMDHLNAMVEIQERTGVDVPEREYVRLRSLRALADHVSSALGGSPDVPVR